MQIAAILQTMILSTALAATPIGTHTVAIVEQVSTIQVYEEMLSINVLERNLDLMKIFFSTYNQFYSNHEQCRSTTTKKINNQITTSHDDVYISNTFVHILNPDDVNSILYVELQESLLPSNHIDTRTHIRL